MSNRRRITTSDDESEGAGAVFDLTANEPAADSDDEWDGEAMGIMNAVSQEAGAADSSSGENRFPKGVRKGGDHRILESRIDDEDNVEFYVEFEMTTAATSSSSSSSKKVASLKAWRSESDTNAMMPSVVQKWRKDMESKSSRASRPRRGAASHALSKISDLSHDSDYDEDDDEDAGINHKKKAKEVAIDDDDNYSDSQNSDDSYERKKVHATPSASAPGDAATRQSSGRSKSLASKSARRRQEALDELTKRGGLSALSESEYEDSGGSDEEGEDFHGGNVVMTSRRDDFFRKRNQVPKKRDLFRKPRTPEPSEGGDSDVDDFIVHSDEEREEEERLLREEREARKRKKAARKLKELEREEEKRVRKKTLREEEEEEEEDLVVVRSSQKRKRRSILTDDDDDDDDEYASGDDDKGGDSGDGKEDCEDEEGEEEGDDDDDDDDDDESVSGPLTYWQVDAMREEKRDAMEDSSLFSSRRSYSREESMRIYIEYLGRAHVDPLFIASVAAEPESPDGRKFLAASRQIENLICTSRESLLGSGAWNKEFVAELQSRPFYSVVSISAQKVVGRCLACNRTSHALGWKASLFGARYDAKRAFSCLRWDREMPDAIFIRSERGVNSQNSSARKRAQEESSDDEDGDDDADEEEASMKDKWWLKKWPRELNKEKETKWELGGHCRFRTQMYHTLLHYKFRLLLKIREKLEKNDNSVARMIADTSFISQEVDRFTQLMDQATSKFGGSEQREYTDLWNEPRDTQERSNRRPSGALTGSFSTPSTIANWLAGQANRSGGNSDENIEQYE